MEESTEDRRKTATRMLSKHDPCEKAIRNQYILINAPQIAAGTFDMHDVNCSDYISKNAVEIAGMIFDKVHGIKDPNDRTMDYGPTR